MPWFIFALLSLFSFLFYDLASRYLSIDSKNPRAFSFIYNFFAGIFSLGFFLIEPFYITGISANIWVLAAIMIFLYGIFNRYEYYAHKYVEASTLSLIFKITYVITFVCSIVFFHETFTMTKGIAALLIFCGVILVTYKRHALKLQKGMGYGFLVAIVLGFAWIVDKQASSFFPLPLWAFMGYFLPNIFVVPFPSLRMSEIFLEWKRLQWRVVLLSAFASCGYYFLIKAFSVGEASNVILVTSSETLFIVLFGALFLHERENFNKKLLAACFVVVGQLLLYFG